MIKNFKTIAIIAIIGISLTYSCKKDIENSIDCLAETAYVHLNHSIDVNDAKKAILVITYTGEYSLDNSVKWDFGDGVTKTLNGKSVEHIYSNLGTYKVKAEVITRNGDAYCGHEIDETVKIE